MFQPGLRPPTTQQSRCNSGPANTMRALPPCRLAFVGSTDPECFMMTDGADYRGSVAKTKTGRTCLPWSQQTKAAGGSGFWTGSRGAADKGVGDHNYCRNPDGEPGAWCYTTSSSTRYEYCEVGSVAATCAVTHCPLQFPHASKWTHHPTDTICYSEAKWADGNPRNPGHTSWCCLKPNESMCQDSRAQMCSDFGSGTVPTIHCAPLFFFCSNSPPLTAPMHLLCPPPHPTRSNSSPCDKDLRFPCFARTFNVPVRLWGYACGP